MPAPIILQKAVTPPMAQAYLRQGLDRVAGYVVRASEVAEISSTADLIELHNLAFEGSPFSADRPIHVLHLVQPPTATHLKATGGTTREQVQQAGGGFLERAPFRGDGTTGVGESAVDLVWVEHTRLTPGSRLWRFDPGAQEPVLVGTYHGVVFGWQDHENDDAFRPLATRGLVGTVATTPEGVYPADVRAKDDGTPNVVTIVSYNPKAGQQGFTQTKAGTFARQLSFSEVQNLAENYVTARWHGLPVRIIDEGKSEDGKTYVRLFSLARDADAAERLGMDKMDVGWYETTAPTDALTDIVRSQRVPKPWARPEQLQNAEKTAEQLQQQRNQPQAPAAQVPLNQPNSPMVGMPVPTNEDGTPMDSGDQRVTYGPALQTIAQGVVNGAPIGWQRIRVLSHMLGNGGDIMVAATNAEGKDMGLNKVPQQVAKSLAQLRYLAATPGEGSWFTALITVEPNGKINMRLDTNGEPKLTKEPTEQRLREEARFFPRDGEHTPQWLSALYEKFGIDPAAEREEGAQDRAEAEAAREADLKGMGLGGQAGGDEPDTQSSEQPAEQSSEQPADKPAKQSSGQQGEQTTLQQGESAERKDTR